jgi:endonuclease/exonuclease/phosphatase family metal-dependent hydrolase
MRWLRLVSTLAVLSACSGEGAHPAATAPSSGAGGSGATAGAGGAAGEGGAAPLALDVWTFNLRYDNPDDGANAWPHRRDFVATLLRDAAPDVVGVQEALRSQLDDLAERLPYDEVGVGRVDGHEAGEYSAILFDAERFDVAASDTFWLSDTPEVPGSTSWGNTVVRICTWARLVERASGRGLFVFNTHLDHQSQSSRARSVELIAARVAERDPPDPFLLLGDFNAGETNRALRYLRGEVDRASTGDDPVPPSPGLVDTFRVVHPDAEDVGTYHAFEGGTDGNKIDYVLARPAPETEVFAAEIVHASDGALYPSDHFPVTATLAIRRDTP